MQQTIKKQVGLGEFPAFPFQFNLPNGHMAQTGLTFRHLAAIHIMAQKVSVVGINDLSGTVDGVAAFAVKAADALAEELDRTESMGAPHQASEDTELLNHMEKHLCRACKVNGGPKDGEEGKAFVIAGDHHWSLRDMLRDHKSMVDAGDTPQDETPGGVVIKPEGGGVGE